MNILIIKFGALGDVVMSTSLIAAIQRKHPNDTIHLLTSPPFAPIFAEWSDLHVTARERRGVRNTVGTARWIRRLSCKRIYDLQGNNRSALLCAVSGSPLRVGNHPRFPYTHHPPDRWTGQCHIFERMLRVLEAAGVGEVERVPALRVGDAEHETINEWLRTHALARHDFVVLHATASAARADKIWPHFEALGRRLGALGLCPVWVGTGSDAPENQRLCAAAGGIDATDCFSIAALAALGGQARFAVTNDSGPMHVLSAAGIPVFGLFGPSDWRRNHALGQRENVIACTEIIDQYRGLKSADCLSRVSCEVVWERLTQAGLL